MKITFSFKSPVRGEKNYYTYMRIIIYLYYRYYIDNIIWSTWMKKPHSDPVEKSSKLLYLLIN